MPLLYSDSLPYTSTAANPRKQLALFDTQVTAPKRVIRNPRTKQRLALYATESEVRNPGTGKYWDIRSTEDGLILGGGSLTTAERDRILSSFDGCTRSIGFDEYERAVDKVFERLASEGGAS